MTSIEAKLQRELDGKIHDVSKKSLALWPSNGGA